MEICSHYFGLLHNKYILVFELVIDILTTIYKAIDSFTHKKYVVKVFDKYDSSMEEEIKINKIVSESNNPFFIKYIDSSSGYLVIDNIEEYKYYIVFENASKGDLLKYINNKNGFPEKVCKFIFYKILKAIQSLHKLGISHRNIKIDNIFLDGNNYDIKIGDFSLATLFNNEKGEKILLKKVIKTTNYTAPEIIMEHPYDGEKVDIFSLGVLLFHLRTGSYGFKDANINCKSLNINEKLYRLIKNKKFDTYWKFMEKILELKELSQEFKKLYFKLVSFNPKERPTIEEIFNSCWLKEINDLSEEELKTYEKELIDELKKREEILNI